MLTVFEFNSVMNVTIATMMMFVAANGIEVTTPPNFCPTTCVSPDSAKPWAMAKPPPKSSNTPNANFDCAYFHVIMASPGLCTEGTKKRTSIVRMATEGSPRNVVSG